jgi:hypothetical protein
MEERVRALPDESIYDEAGRLAQPDEVWNYGRGDGAEKAILLANLLRSGRPDDEMNIDVKSDRIVLRTGSAEYEFESKKRLREQTWAVPTGAVS